MSQKPLLENSMQPLSIGNAVSLSLYLYRARLKLYLKLSLIAHLWLLVPLYGWAKFYAISGLISRLVFCELSGKPESLNTAKKFIKPKLLNFLITSILVVMFSTLMMLLSVIIMFVITILIVVIFLIFATITNYGFVQDFYDWLGVLLAMVLFFILPISSLWLYSHLFITDILLATETNINSFKTIKESWKLTKGLINYNQGIMALTFLITLPVSSLNMVLAVNLLTLIYYLLKPVLPISLLNSSIWVWLSLLIMNFLTSVITLPLWQSAKATLYYEIWNQKDAFKLKLQNRNL